MIMTFNACLALITSLVIVSTLNHMAKGKTPPAIMLAMVVIFAGMVGQGAGVLIGQLAELVGEKAHGWDHFVDTLLYGGLLAFVMACRRFPISRHKAGALDKASLIVSAVTLIAALALIP